MTQHHDPLGRDALATEIIRTDVPVLLLDSCAILDVVRTPVRDQIRINHIIAVHNLLDRVVAEQPSVSFVIAAQVLREFQEHIVRVEEVTHHEIKKIADRFAAMVRRVRALFPDENFSEAVDLLSMEIAMKSRQLSELIVQSSFVLEADFEDYARAARRSVDAKPPATEAKQSTKDCLIVESYLCLAGNLRSGNFSRNIVFISSNTKDYQRNDRTLHPSLKAEFDAVGLEYSPNWSAARYEIDKDRTSGPATDAN